MNTSKTGRSNTGQPQKQCRLPKAGLAAQLVTPSQLCQVEQGLVPTLCLILQRKHTTGGKSDQMLTWSVNSPLKTGRNQRWDENQFLKNLNTKGEDWGRIYWLYIYQPLRLKKEKKENETARICVFSLPNTDCNVPKDLARGSSQPKPSHRSTECERDHLLSSQNQCKLDIPPALVFQHPAIKQRYKKLKSSEQSLIQTVQLLLRVGLMQNSTQELGLEVFWLPHISDYHHGSEAVQIPIFYSS